MKYKTFFLLIISIAILTTASTCNKDKDGCHIHIQVINSSNGDIYFYFGNEYPDTTIHGQNPVLFGSDYRINKQTSKEIAVSKTCYEYQFDNANSKKIFFIYDANTIEATPWDTVIKNYLILSRLELTLKDLNNMNWTITYP